MIDHERRLDGADVGEGGERDEGLAGAVNVDRGKCVGVELVLRRGLKNHA